MTPIRLQHNREAVQSHLDGGNGSRKRRVLHNSHSRSRYIYMPVRDPYYLYHHPLNIFTGNYCSPRFTARIFARQSQFVQFICIYSRQTSAKLQYNCISAVDTRFTPLPDLWHRTASCTRMKLLLSYGCLRIFMKTKTNRICFAYFCLA